MTVLPAVNSTSILRRRCAALGLADIEAIALARLRTAFSVLLRARILTGLGAGAGVAGRFRQELAARVTTANKTRCPKKQSAPLLTEVLLLPMLVAGGRGACTDAAMTVVEISSSPPWRW
jgi:hypothetical protein